MKINLRVDLLNLRNSFPLVSFSAILVSTLGTASLADSGWPNFLGPNGNPVTNASLPTEFSVASDDAEATNIAWHVPLAGRSVSGPIVVDGKVITTGSSSVEERWMNVTAVDADSGEVLWQRSTKATGRPFCHPSSANAAPTPCSDGERIFAFFSSNDLVCYDLDGNLQWFKSLTQDHPLAGNDVGMSSSPITVDGVVIATVECQADSFTVGLSCKTGEKLWEVSRPPTANWASPRVVEGSDGKSVVVLQGGSELVAIDPKSGASAWSMDISCGSVASSAFNENKLYLPANGVQVLEIGNAFDAPKKGWDSSRISPNSASLLVTKYGVIGLNRSILVCCDDEGERIWNARLEDAGQIWATPVVAGDYLYAFSMDGKCFTVQLGQEKAEVVSVSELGTEVLGSPAIDGDALYVRSVDGLWKIAADK